MLSSKWQSLPPCLATLSTPFDLALVPFPQVTVQEDQGPHSSQVQSVGQIDSSQTFTSSISKVSQTAPPLMASESIFLLLYFSPWSHDFEQGLQEPQCPTWQSTGSGQLSPQYQKFHKL